MATAFVAELWESIFTPGPSPVLLKAANATFAALQILLFVLLLVTHSLHFVALSLICGGLWGAINWFAAELAIATERQRTAEREQTEDSETEVEPSEDMPDVQVGGEGVEVRDGGDGLRRRDAGPGTQSSASTEDEWEKVSENENDKQK